jgi:hypothetical protein
MNILLGSAGGGGTSNPGGMINWRMVGTNLATLTTPSLGWSIILAGSLLTIFFTFRIFRRSSPEEISAFSISLLGIFTATLLVTWHAHVHMAIILYPLMIYLIIKNRMKFDLMLIWIFAPIFLRFFTLIIFLLFPTIDLAIQQLIYGGRFLLVNLLLLIWCFNAYLQIRKGVQQNALFTDTIIQV